MGKTDLLEFPILPFELVVFFAQLPRVLGVLHRGRGEWLMRRDGGRAHDDVSVYGRRRGQHWGRPAGHGEREDGKKKRGGMREREGAPRLAMDGCVIGQVRQLSGPPDHSFISDICCANRPSIDHDPVRRSEGL